jgi:DNA-binding GntR family transcriptional regulator
MVDRVNLTDQVYAYLRDAIVTGALPSGSQHSVYRLAEELGVSRTPVREAVLRLADTGMVSVERNRGIRIHGTTVEEIRNVFELRLLIEVPAAAYAARNGSEEFFASLRAASDAMAAASAVNDEEQFRSHDRALHGLIADVLGNPRLSSALSGLRDATRARGAWTGNRSRELNDIVSEHSAIVDALLARDPDGAAAAMREHLERTGTLLMRQIAPVGGNDIPENWARRLDR